MDFYDEKWLKEQKEKKKEQELFSPKSNEQIYSYKEEGWDYIEEYEKEQNMSLAKHYGGVSRRAKLQEELNAGPPGHLSFAERIKWKNRLKEEINSEKAKTEETKFKINQEIFLQNVHEDKEYLDMKLDKKMSISVNTASEYYAKVLRVNEHDDEAFKLRRLIPESEKSSFPDYDKIEMFMKEMNARIRLFEKEEEHQDSAWMQEDAKKMYLAYEELHLKNNTAFSNYMKDVSTREPRSCYMFLYHSLLMNILNITDKMSPDKVDFIQYGKLHSRIMSTGRILSRMCRSNDFKEKRVKILKDEEEQRRYQELRQAKENFLKNGITPTGKMDLSVIRPYLELALYGRDKDLLKEMALDKYIEAIGTKQEVFKKNKEALDNYKDDFLYETYGGEFVKNMVLEQSIKNSRMDIFNYRLASEEIQEIVEKARQQVLEQNKWLTERREYLDKKENLKKFPNLYDIPEIQKLFQFKQIDYFKDQVDAWVKNAEANETFLNIFMEQKIPFYCREHFKEEMIRNGAQVLIFGNPEQVEFYGLALYRKLRVKDPSVVEYEKNLKKKMKKEGVPSYYYQTLIEQLKEGDIEAQIRLFRQNLQEQEKPCETLKYQPKKSVFQTHTRDELNKNLCNREEFDGILNGWEKGVMDALDKVLENKQISYPFLRDVSSGKDLKVLRVPEFQILMERLRTNIANGLTEWSSVNGVYSEEIKTNLLPELLTGKLTKELIQEESDKAIQRHKIDEKEEFVQKNLFEMTLEEEDAMPQFIQYRYLDAKAAFRKDQSLAEKRLSDFNRVDLMWELLRERGLEEEVWKVCLEGKNEDVYKKLEEVLGTKSKENAVNIRYGRQNYYGVQRWTTWKQSPGSLVHSVKDLMDEFCFFGMQDVVFNKTENKALFAGEKDPVYEKNVEETSHIIRSRMKELNVVFEKHSLSFEDKKKYYLKLREIIGGIDKVEQGEEEKETRNRQSFGVNSWEDAVEKLDQYLSANKEKTNENVQELNHVKIQRQDYLERWGGGILKPVLRQLLLEPKFKTMLLTANQEDFAHMVDDLGGYLKAPLKVMAKFYGMENNFVLQMAEDKLPQMLGGSSFHELITKILNREKVQNNQVIDWKEEFDDYFEEYSNHSIGKTSISKMMEDILQDNPTIWNIIKKGFKIEDSEIKKYLNFIILRNPEGIALLQNQQLFKNVMLRADENLQKNMEELQNFFNAKTEEVTQTTKEGFRMFMQTELIMRESEDFKKELEEAYEVFQELEMEIQEDVLTADRLMSEKRKIMTEIAGKKCQGRNREENVIFEETQELYRQSNVVESPVLTAWGRTKEVSFKEIKNVSVEANKKEFLMNLPPVIIEILKERMLTGAGDEELKPEAEWLADTYEKICSTKFGDSKKTLNPYRAMELLMFSYISQKDKGWEESVDVQEIYRQLQARKKKYEVLKVVQEASKEKRCQQALQALRMDMYVGESSSFEKKADIHVAYFSRLEQVRPIFEEEIKKYVTDKKMHVAIFGGLEECFREKLLEGKERLSEESLLSIQKEVGELLKDEKKHTYICNSEHLLESISYDSMTEQEKTNRGMMNREEFEKVLSGCKNEKLLAQYSSLDVPARQLFSLVLGEVKDGWGLLTSEFIKTKEGEIAEKTAIKNQIQDYIIGKREEFDVDYNLAVSQIQMQDGSIDVSLFQTAMARTKKYLEEISQEVPRDYERLSDAEDSMSFVRRLKGLPAGNDMEAKSFEDLIEKLQKDSLKKGKQELINQLVSLQTDQQAMLVGLLQDRTILDQSVRTQKQVVNQEKRDSIKQEWINNDLDAYKSKTTSENWKHASVTLMSYQIRDDIKIGKRKLRKEDFTKEVWERSTTYDWDLLERALELLKEIQNEQVKQTDKKYAYGNMQKGLEHMPVYREKDVKELEIAIPPIMANLELESIYSNYYTMEEICFDNAKLITYARENYKVEFPNINLRLKERLLERLQTITIPEIIQKDIQDESDEVRQTLFKLLSDAKDEEKDFYMVLLKNREWIDAIDDISTIKEKADLKRMGMKELEQVCDKYFRNSTIIFGEKVNEEERLRNKADALRSLFTTKGKSIHNTEAFVSEMMNMTGDFDRETILDWKLLQKITKFVNQMRIEKYSDEKIDTLDNFLKGLHPEKMVTSLVLQRKESRENYQEFKQQYNKIENYIAKKKEHEQTPQIHLRDLSSYFRTEEVDSNQAETDASYFGKQMLERFKEAIMGPRGVVEYIEATYMNKNNMKEELTDYVLKSEEEKLEAYRDMFGYGSYEQMQEEAGKYWVHALMHSVTSDYQKLQCKTMSASMLWNLGLLEEVKNINEESVKKVYDTIKNY